MLFEIGTLVAFMARRANFIVDDIAVNKTGSMSPWQT